MLGMASNLRMDASHGSIEDAQKYQYHLLLMERRSIDAKLATFRQQHRSPIYKHSRQNGNLSRSLSSTGVPVGDRHLSGDQIEVSSKMLRASSQRSSTSMARSCSKSTSQNRRSPPSTICESRTQPFNTNHTADNPAMTSWTAQEQPRSEYTVSHQPAHVQRQASYPEHVSEMQDPVDFIIRNASSSIPSLSRQSFTLTSPFNQSGALTPQSDTLTCGTTLTSTSRSNSLCNDGILQHSMQMMRVNSNISLAQDNYVYTDQNIPFASPVSSYVASIEDQSQLLRGTGGASTASLFTRSHNVSSSVHPDEKMEKSQSTESNSLSLLSQSSRNIKRLQEQNSTAVARLLMPKGRNEETPRSSSSQSMSRSCSNDSDKVAISKSTYTRPKHDRVYCRECEAHPEGFRGEHEFRRHKDREHAKTVKKWICIEPQVGQDRLEPILPLAKCKACSQQKKKYNAYYNAAAHLRRAHFRPKAPKGRSKQNKTDVGEKRGGKGGGDWPKMDELKTYWMKEVEEVANTDMREDDEASHNEDLDDPVDDCLPNQHTLSTNNFETRLYYDAPSTDTPYSLLNISYNDPFTMQMVPSSNSTQQSHCMDSSMYTDAAQSMSSFPLDSYQFAPSLSLYEGGFDQNLLLENEFSYNFPSGTCH